jgi:hypothetical protein
VESKTKDKIPHDTIQEMEKLTFGSDTNATEISELNNGWYNSAYSLNLNNGELRLY